MKQLKDKDPVVKIERVNKSVRTTFNLTQDGIKSMEWIKRHYGITLKSLFDILSLPQKTKENPFLSATIEMVQKLNLDNLKLTVRKTMVISERAQRILNRLSKDKKVPRDILVDKGVMLLEQVLKKGEADRKTAHEKALGKIDAFRSDAGKIEETLIEILGSEDPIVNRFGFVIVLIDNLQMAIGGELKDGTPISPDDYGQSC